MQDSKKNTILYNEAINNELLLICKPLFENLGITDFGYTRYDKDGSLFMIETNHLWLKTYYNYGYSDDINNPFSELQQIRQTPLNEFRVFPYISKPETLVHSLLFDAGMWNGLSVYRRFNFYGEAFHFQSKIENLALPFYLLNNLDLIKHFILYFENKIKEISKFNNIPKIKYEEKENLLNIFEQFDTTPKEIKKFLNETHLNKINIPNIDISLTLREINCLRHTASGRTAKEIAKIMNLSPRTIESYDNILRKKLRVFNKNDMIQIWEEKIHPFISKHQKYPRYVISGDKSVD